MKQLPFTVIILTNRKDGQFVRSLQSVQFAKEVLIIDNHSGNDWKALAKKYRFRLVNYLEPIENFAAVRNFALDKATNRWVFFLDSDEVFPADCRSTVEKIMISDIYDGVMIKRSDVFLGKKLKYGEAGNQNIMRFFKKDLTRFNHAVHEIAKVHGRIGYSDIIIVHFAHESIADFIDTVVGYSKTIGYNRSFAPGEVLIQLILFPPLKFFYNFVLRLGFLDGWRGAVYAIVMSLHSASVRIFAYEKDYS